jgi:branched-chain amino acid transport system substrate-binding protein
MKKFLALTLALCMVFALCACGSTASTPSTSASSNATISIGVFEPATGENGAGGQQEVLGIRYANSVKPTVTIAGVTYDVKLEEVDNQSDKSAAVTAAQTLISKGVIAVLGSYGSGVSIAAGSTFANAKVPAVGCSCTNPQVTLGNDYYFRVCFLDPFQGTVMANYASSQGCKTAAVINQNGDDYSTGLANYFKDAFAKMDGCSVAYEGTYNTNETDFNAILAKVKEANPDVVFIPSSITTAGLIIKQARDLGIKSKIMAGDTWQNATIIDNAGASNCEGIAMSTFFDESDPNSADFVKGLKEYINSDSKNLTLNGGNDTVAAVSALGYDAYMTVLTALESLTAAPTGETLRDALAKTTYAGVTGSISFDENGDAVRDMAYIDMITNGAFKFVGTQKTDGTFTAAS